MTTIENVTEIRHYTFNDIILSKNPLFKKCGVLEKQKLFTYNRGFYYF